MSIGVQISKLRRRHEPHDQNRQRDSQAPDAASFVRGMDAQPLGTRRSDRSHLGEAVPVHVRLHDREHFGPPVDDLSQLDEITRQRRGADLDGLDCARRWLIGPDGHQAWLLGKEQRIEIKAGSGLSEEEIDKMVKDAELHAEEDKKFHEVVTARNNADAMVHATRSSLKEMGDKIGEDERKTVESAIEGVEEAMKGDDKSAIDAAVEKLSQAGAVIYQKAAEQAQAEQAQGGADAAGSAAPEDDVVDAEFEEVDDDKT